MSFIIHNGNVGLCAEQIKSSGGADLGFLYNDGDATDPKYAILENVEDVTIDGFGIEWDEFTTVRESYTKYIEIKETGSVSFTVLADYKSSPTSAEVSASNLIHAGIDYPMGFSTNTGAEYDASLDTAVAKGDDETGWAVIVEQKVDSGDYYYWIFHNCMIEVSPQFTSKKTTRLNVKLTNARYVDFDIVEAGTSKVNDGDASGAEGAVHSH